MGKPFVVNQAGMRILIDPDDPARVPKKMVEYKLSPEEIEKRYGNIKGIGKTKPIVPGDMKEYWKRKKREKKGEDEAMSRGINFSELDEETKALTLKITEEADKDMENKPIMKLTKAEIIRLHNEGKSVDELVEYFLPGWHGKPGVLKAKVSYYLNYKKPKPRTKKAAPDTIEYPGLKDVSESLCESINEAVKIAAGNTDQPLLNETEEYPNIRAVLEESLNEKITKKAQRMLEEHQTRVDVLSEVMEMLPDKTDDNINHPAHYTSGNIETIDFIQDKLSPEEFEGFCKGVILQYVSRCRLKGGVNDIRKAIWYANRLVSFMEATPAK